QARLLWALATLRPQLLTAWSSATASDRALAELCLRRTVTTVLAPLVRSSGTPTCVWRGSRGGEVVLAGDEFCAMVGFRRSEL
ncbi:hypothetical protein DFJ73DRAFT_607015, partial [Zopfochytrium polystomum]